MNIAKGKPLFSPSQKKEEPIKPVGKPWKIFIVDDDEEVHSVSKLALSNFSFGGKPIEFIHAYSAAEAKEIFATTPDIALVLLDVVMETDHAGLDVVRYVRNELKNTLTRIVLRTGQPGQAPERKVITDYDINDYKEKTELTSQKLFTLVCASLRAYRDMVALDGSRKGLKKVIDASASIFTLKSMKQFAEGALDQMLSLLHIADSGSFYISPIDSLAASKHGANFNILAGTGKYYEMAAQQTPLHLIPLDIIERLQNVAKEGGHVFESDHIISYYRGRTGHENLLYVNGELDYEQIDTGLVELYARNVGIAFENMELHRQLEETQKEIVYRLGEAVETRSLETGNHLKRVAEICRILALEYGLSVEEAETIKYASPLHDIGKIAIPDNILNKKGKLTADEWTVMKTHAELGHKMLSTSDKPILKAGSIIAREHHEKWDGSGYPRGKKGEDIHIYGRIVAIADVYDALANKRSYKEAWPLPDVYKYMEEQSGKHFEPKLIDILGRNLDRIEAVMMRNPDTSGR